MSRSAVDGDDLREIRRELRQIRAELAKRPLKVKGGGGSTTSYLLKIIDGQTVYSAGATTLYGVSRSGSAISTVTSLWDPNSVASTAGLFTADTGIGRAQLYINGVLQASMVLVCFDTASAIPTALVQGDTATATSTRTLTLASDATQSVLAYLPIYL